MKWEKKSESGQREGENDEDAVRPFVLSSSASLQLCPLSKVEDRHEELGQSIHLYTNTHTHSNICISSFH